ncbi:HAD family hydrolase [Actinoplanes sp. NPDC051470]|uniref:HAD family hydrolase n=1 Tax=Actinoplanes sp. NPDC051470 TaxID=3157224 RepID=UPI003434BC69
MSESEPSRAEKASRSEKARRTLVMWDIDRTLLHGGGVTARAWKAAFAELTGLEWRETPQFGGRTDLDICAEVFRVHGVTDHTAESFFDLYLRRIEHDRHLFAEQGALMPGVREVLSRLAADPRIVQTLVTGNLAPVARAKVEAFGLHDVFDEEIGGYGGDHAVRATLVRRSLERAHDKYAEPFRAVVVGDTVNDVAAALANDVAVVGVATGSTTAAELHHAGAEAVLPDLSDVDHAVRTIAG